MSVRLVYEDIAVGAAEDAAVSTTARTAFSDPAQLPYGAQSVPIAALEGNGWLLNGARRLLNGQKVGFWSTQMSGEDGTFAAPPTITVTFDEQYTSLGLSMTFDPATGEYCSGVTVQWYQGTALLAEEDFSPNAATYFFERTVEHYNKIVIRLSRTSLPGRYAKVSQIMFGITREFLRDELRSVSVTEDINLISEEVSVNTMDFSLDSRSGVEFIFQRLQPIYAYNGDVLIGAFYVETASRKGEDLYDLSCNDAIGVLDYETIPAVMYSGKNVKAALEEVLDGKFELELAPELAGETVTGYIPEGTRRNALHHIAFAVRAIVDTSGTQAVRVFRAPASDPAEIPQSRIYTGGSVETSAIVTEIRVTAHSYSTTGSGTSVEAGGKTYYDTQTVISIKNPDVTASDKQNVVEIRDATLVNPSNATAVAQNVYDYYTRRRTQKMKIVVDKERPGDLITAATNWGDVVTGNIVSMSLTLSGIVAAECEVVGT